MVQHVFPFPLKPGDHRNGLLVDFHRGRWPTDLEHFWRKTKANLPQRDQRGKELNLEAWLTYFFMDGWTRRPKSAPLPEPPLEANPTFIQEEGWVWVVCCVTIPESIQAAFDKEVKRRGLMRSAVCLDYIRWSVRQHQQVWHEPVWWVGHGLTADARAAMARATPKQRRVAAEAALHDRDHVVFKHLLSIEPALTRHLTTWLMAEAKAPTPVATQLGLLVILAPITPWLDDLSPGQLLAVGQALKAQPKARARVLKQPVTTSAAKGLLTVLRAMGSARTRAPVAPTPKGRLTRRT